MVEQVRIVRSTQQLIEQAEAREGAIAQVRGVMERATGVACDRDETVEVTVNARGKLMNLRMTPQAINWGERLGPLIVEVARVAMREATQNSYNQVALALGDDLTLTIERLSGMPAPARAENDDNGLTVEEFQRRRAERLAAGQPAGTPPPRPAPVESEGDDDWESFDPASLRSDR